MSGWIEPHRRGITISLHVQPNAPRTEVQGEHGGALKVKLAAPPVDGKANEVLLKWIAKQIGVSRSAVELLAGEKDRRKRVLVVDPSASIERIVDALDVAERNR